MAEICSNTTIRKHGSLLPPFKHCTFGSQIDNPKLTVAAGYRTGRVPVNAAICYIGTRPGWSSLAGC